MADLSWTAALVDVSGGAGSAGGGKSIASAGLTEDGELELKYTDGTSDKLGKVVGESGKTYVPHIDEGNVLSFTVEEGGDGTPPDPVDLDAHGEWKDMGAGGIGGDQAWHEMPGA